MARKEGIQMAAISVQTWQGMSEDEILESFVYALLVLEKHKYLQYKHLCLIAYIAGRLSNILSQELGTS